MDLRGRIVRKILEKKELSLIDPRLVEKALSLYLKKNRFLIEKLSAAQLKIVIKDIRASLRESVGRFQIGIKDRERLLEIGEIQKLLNTHSSTKERIDFYPTLKEIIRKTGAKSILDLGCGINPLALADLKVKYYASDINLSDLNLVKNFFEKKKIDGEVFICDLTKIENCKLPEVDLVLLLKVFDILGKEDYKIAKRVLEAIKSKHLIISFSTRTLSGKKMNRPRRLWFEKLLNSSFYRFDTLSSANEIFYLV